MTPIHVRTISGAVLVFFTLVGGATGQTTPVLNSLEVQQLIKRAEPGDHARLGAHFAALAEQYAADAKKHEAMAGAFLGSPARRTPVNSAADHCKRLATLNTRSATTLRELAAHHDALATGKAAAVPRGATRFEGGAGAPAPTAEQLSAMAAKAATPADHHGLEEYFQTLAKRYTADANDHAAMAQAYRGTRIAQAAAHCDRLAANLRESAKEATAAATMHKDLATIAR